MAGLAKGFETGGKRLGRVFFFEYGSKDGEGGLGRGRCGYFFWRVTGDCYQWICWWEFAGESAGTTLLPNFSNFFGRDVIGAEMDAMGGSGKGDVHAGVDEESSGRRGVVTRQSLVMFIFLIDNADGVAG